MTKHQNTLRVARSTAMIALVGILAGCGDLLSLDIEAPGRIADDDLNTTSALPGLVAGMSYDLTGGFQSSLQEVILAGGELWHGGSYDFGTIPRGVLLEEDEYWNGEYGSMQQARWVAEDGLRRMAGILPAVTFEKSPLVARAYLLAGFANRVLGEVQCVSTIDGGPQVPNTEHFLRADSLFTRAITVGTAANQAAIVNAAYGGRASVRAWLDNWNDAVTDAARVPATFSYSAIFSTLPGAISNDLVFETTRRKEFTVFSTIWQNVPSDPRVPWAIKYDSRGQVERGQDGETPFYQQLKLKTEDDDIRLTHGSEMLVLRAEARLRTGDIPGMVSLLNQARTVYDMGPVTQPSSLADAWALLRFERGATTWLEGRRLWDLRRWREVGGVVADPYAADRDVCFPISREEKRANTNLS